MGRNLKIGFVILFLGFLSCKNGDQRHKTKELNHIYTEYSFWGEEEKEFITGLFQFRPGGEKSTPAKLNAPAAVALDGAFINADSAGFTGTFYEIHQPFESFSGKHTITFTSEDGEQHSETFTFTPFHLSTEPGDEVSREQMVLSFTGLEDNDLVRVVITDTSFSSNGINEIDTIHNGQLDLSAKLKRNVKNGPVLLHIFKEEERLLQKNPHINGKISITYSLKREFELRD